MESVYQINARLAKSPGRFSRRPRILGGGYWNINAKGIKGVGRWEMGYCLHFILRLPIRKFYPTPKL
jgi:hypothetical protein